MTKVKGYIFSRPFQEERVPQHIQNIVIRDFCLKKSLKFFFSASEYKMENCFLILKDLVKNLSDVDGIVAYSLFQMPENNTERNNILKDIVKRKKFIYFAVEQSSIFSLNDIKNIDFIWKIKKTLINCIKEI